MPSDYIVMLFYGPVGLVALGIAIGIIWGVWRFLLGDEYLMVGAKPLLAGTGAFLLVVLAQSAVSASIEYADRVPKYPEIGGYWAVVPGWTLYGFAILLIVLLLILCLVFVPAAAFLARIGRLSWPNVVLVLATAWVLATLIHGLFPTNQWGMDNRLEYFWQALTRTAMVIWPAFGAFLASVKLSIGRYGET